MLSLLTRVGGWLTGPLLSWAPYLAAAAVAWTVISDRAVLRQQVTQLQATLTAVQDQAKKDAEVHAIGLAGVRDVLGYAATQSDALHTRITHIKEAGRAPSVACPLPPPVGVLFDQLRGSAQPDRR